MKTTLNAVELSELDACEEGLQTFIEAHNSDTVTLSQALDSNGWNDIWWYIAEVWRKLDKSQQDDLHLIGCDWAERMICSFEKEFPEDDRPRKAIEAKRAYMVGEIDAEELAAARSAARSAAWLARSAARSAAWSAARSATESAWSAARSAPWSAAWSAAESAARSAAWSAAESAPWSAAWSAAMEEMTAELRDLFVKWEQQL